MKEAFDYAISANLACTEVDNRLTFERVEVTHKNPHTQNDWIDNDGHYTPVGVDMILFGLSAATIGVIHAAQEHSGMDPAKLLRQTIAQLGLLFVEQTSSVVDEAELTLTLKSSLFSRMEQTLVEFMGDFLDAEIVELEQAQAGMKDPLPKHETELHIRMAKAAMAEYRRTVVAG